MAHFIDVRQRVWTIEVEDSIARQFLATREATRALFGDFQLWFAMLWRSVQRDAKKRRMSANAFDRLINKTPGDVASAFMEAVADSLAKLRLEEAIEIARHSETLAKLNLCCFEPYSEYSIFYTVTSSNRAIAAFTELVDKMINEDMGIIAFGYSEREGVALNLAIYAGATVSAAQRRKMFEVSRQLVEIDGPANGPFPG